MRHVADQGNQLRLLPGGQFLLVGRLLLDPFTLYCGYFCLRGQDSLVAFLFENQRKKCFTDGTFIIKDQSE